MTRLTYLLTALVSTSSLSTFTSALPLHQKSALSRSYHYGSHQKRSPFLRPTDDRDQSEPASKRRGRGIFLGKRQDDDSDDAGLTPFDITFITTVGADSQTSEPVAIQTETLTTVIPVITLSPTTVTAQVVQTSTTTKTVVSTVIVSPSPSSSPKPSYLPSPSPSPTSRNPFIPVPQLSSSATSRPTGNTAWKLAEPMPSDLSAAFNVKNWSWGKSLVTVLPSLPSTAATGSATPAEMKASTPKKSSSGPSAPPKPNNDSVMQVLYPKGSINPAQKPQGGVGFYAQPLDISKSNNVSLSYSVFFPSDFDFVLGGKLPGLYGGHGGCSGGKSSENCFSTRLMFRPNGLGELYLYVPKGNQSASLCSTPPQSICDSQYGLSIGRGAWTFAKGQWTDVRQDIWLNTPGKNDGGFNVWVNGQLVLHSDSVFFRGAKDSSSSSASPAPTSTPIASSADPDPVSSASPTTTTDGGLLGGLLGDLLPPLEKRSAPTPLSIDEDGKIVHGSMAGDEFANASGVTETDKTFPTSTTIVWKKVSSTVQAPPSTITMTETSTQTKTAVSTSTVTLQPSSPPSPSHLSGSGIANVLEQGQLLDHSKSGGGTVKGRAGFLGIMFDTFFGGHEAKYASPKDQYSYFNGVSLVIN